MLRSDIFPRQWLAFFICVPACFTLAGEPSPGKFPMGKAKWVRESHEEEFAAFEKEVRALMALPADKVAAHPAAADFPGVPPTDAKSVTRPTS